MSRGAGLEADEVELLRAGDPATFQRVVRREHPTLFRVARSYVVDDATASDVVQDTWIAAIRGLERFEGRSSLRTWLVRITMNLARKRGARDARLRPVAELGSDEPGGWPVDRFRRWDEPWPGGWTTPPTDWCELADDRITSADTVAAARAAIDVLPERQRVIVLLRDLAGWSAEEVCVALDLTEGNQRVLLHRARSAVRRSLEAVVGP
ncbi:MAG TPA: sigma-70 family RNA polymerase sigma factor [Acidimicrobiales bacterium]